MSLKQQIKDLRRQRQVEVLTLNRTYISTKRDMKRKLSPDRFVRKHIGLMLAAAATGGILLAPRPTPDTVSAKRPTFGGRIGDFLYSAFEPPKTPTDGEPRKEAEPPRGMLGTVVAFVLRHIDIKQVVVQLAMAIAGRKAVQEGPQNGDTQTSALTDEAPSP